LANGSTPALRDSCIPPRESPAHASSTDPTSVYLSCLSCWMSDSQRGDLSSRTLDAQACLLSCHAKISMSTKISAFAARRFVASLSTRMITDIVAEQRSTANAYGDDADVPRMNGISVSVSYLKSPARFLVTNSSFFWRLILFTARCGEIHT